MNDADQAAKATAREPKIIKRYTNRKLYDTVETQAGVTIALPQPKGGLQAPKNPLGAPKLTKGGAQAKSPATKLDEVSEPEPEPWYPDGRGGEDDPDDVRLSTTPDRSDDHK